jgi:hypothetical protein
MTDSNTFYKVGTRDLSIIFNPYTSGQKAYQTNFRLNGTDLCNIFQPLTTYKLTFNTNYIVKNYNNVINSNKDLSDIFERYKISFLSVQALTGTSVSFDNNIYINHRPTFRILSGSGVLHLCTFKTPIF